MIIYVSLIFGFALLIKGADFLVDGATSLAKRFRVSDFVIGLTIVAFGTSAPELFVNIVSSVQGQVGIAIGNVMGSNIANILLVLGLCAVIAPVTLSRSSVWKEVPLCLFVAVLFSLLANIGFGLSRGDGFLLLAFFVTFMIYSFKASMQVEVDESEKHLPLAQAVGLIVIGLMSLSWGGKLIVDSASQIALKFGMSEITIGLTIVAIGTTLPEAVTSVVALLKGKSEIAIGNVLGSNIFNVLFVLGLSAVIRPLPFQVQDNVSIVVMVGASLLLFVMMFTGKKHVLDRWEGGLFLMIYVGYLIQVLTV